MDEFISITEPVKEVLCRDNGKLNFFIKENTLEKESEIFSVYFSNHKYI